MDAFNMMAAMQNPQMYAMQCMMNQMVQQNPQQWEQAQQMMGGKDRRSQLSELKKLYKSRGLDLDATARQYGINI